MEPERVGIGAVAAALLVLVVWTGLLHLRVRNPDAGVVERMREVASVIPAQGTLAFASSAPPRRAGYAYHALRYAIAPRPLRWAKDDPLSDWLVVQGRQQAHGYEQTRHFSPRLGLWKRR